MKSELTAVSCSRPNEGQGHSRGTLIFAMDGTTNGPLRSPLLEFEAVLLPCLYRRLKELYAAPERQRTSGYAPCDSRHRPCFHGCLWYVVVGSSRHGSRRAHGIPPQAPEWESSRVNYGRVWHLFCGMLSRVSEAQTNSCQPGRSIPDRGSESIQQSSEHYSQPSRPIRGAAVGTVETSHPKKHGCQAVTWSAARGIREPMQHSNGHPEVGRYGHLIASHPTARAAHPGYAFVPHGPGLPMPSREGNRAVCRVRTGR